MSCIFDKDDASVVDYTIDWSSTLNATSPNDTISTSSWTKSGGITIDSNSNTTTTATVWLSGGKLNTRAVATNTVVTTQGRTYVRSIYLDIKNL